MKYLSKVNYSPLYDTSEFFKLTEKYQLGKVLCTPKLKTLLQVTTRIKIGLLTEKLTQFFS